MLSRTHMAGMCVIFFLGLVFGASALFTSSAYAAAPVECKIPLKTCAAKMYSVTVQKGSKLQEVPQEAPEKPLYNGQIPNEELSLYKTITYVTGATITDQLWYLAIASAASTTGGLFLGVNAATSSMMTYSYEYFWNLCCQSPPGPDGVVPVSATKAIIYRGLSVIRVSALALLFGNTVASSAVVTGAITLSRTAVYVANDYFWNGINAKAPDQSAVVDISVEADARLMGTPISVR
jgi:hypothetical protein